MLLILATTICAATVSSAEALSKNTKAQMLRAQKPDENLHYQFPTYYGVCNACMGASEKNLGKPCGLWNKQEKVSVSGEMVSCGNMFSKCFDNMQKAGVCTAQLAGDGTVMCHVDTGFGQYEDCRKPLKQTLNCCTGGEKGPTCRLMKGGEVCPKLNPAGQDAKSLTHLAENDSKCKTRLQSCA